MAKKKATPGELKLLLKAGADLVVARATATRMATELRAACRKAGVDINALEKAITADQARRAAIKAVTTGDALAEAAATL